MHSIQRLPVFDAFFAVIAPVASLAERLLRKRDSLGPSHRAAHVARLIFFSATFLRFRPLGVSLVLDVDSLWGQDASEAKLIILFVSRPGGTS